MTTPFHTRKGTLTGTLIGSLIACTVLFSSEAAEAKTAVPALSDTPIETQFRIQFGQRYRRVFYATTPAKITGVVKPLEPRGLLTEHSSQGDYASSLQLAEIAKLKSQITVFLRKTKDSDPAKSRTCFDPIDFQVLGQSAARRCREAMSRPQKKLFLKLVSNLSEASKR